MERSLHGTELKARCRRNPAECREGRRPPPGSRFPAPGLRQCPAHMGSLPAAKRTEAAQGKTAAQPGSSPAEWRMQRHSPSAASPHKSHCMEAPRPLDSRQRSTAMRMWMLPPETMCRKHLLGEHVELHMLSPEAYGAGKTFTGSSPGSWRTPGACSGGTKSLCSKCSGAAHRHASPLDEAECETLARRYGHTGTGIDAGANAAELARRCPECAKRLRRP